MNCNRCGTETSVSRMSYFNTDTLCLTCEQRERAHPDYERAVDADIEACLRGEFNYPGIGLPAELKIEKAPEAKRGEA